MDISLNDLERYLRELDIKQTKSRERNFILLTGEKGAYQFDHALFTNIIAPYVLEIYPKVKDMNNFYGKRADINEALYPYNSDFIQLFEKIRLYIDELQ